MASVLYRQLTDTLWVIDGHHDVFQKQGFGLPSFANTFTGYNCPELKHRKQQRGNMSSSTLTCLSSALFDCLQGPYWERDNWREFKTDVETLAESLSKYSEYLQQSCKKILFIQSRLLPVRHVAENVNFQFLPVCSCPECLSDLHIHLGALSDYEHLPH